MKAPEKIHELIIRKGERNKENSTHRPLDSYEGFIINDTATL